MKPIMFTVNGPHVTLRVEDAIRSGPQAADVEITLDVERLLRFAGYDALHSPIKSTHRWSGAVAVKAVNVRVLVACDWCREHPGQSHSRDGLPLFDRQHQAGVYIDPETADRISRDGA